MEEKQLYTLYKRWGLSFPLDRIKLHPVGQNLHPPYANFLQRM